MEDEEKRIIVDGIEPPSELIAECVVPVDRGSMVQDSLSLRHMAASGLTTDGNVNRVALAAEMAHAQGWRGRRILRALFWLGLVLLVLFILQSVIVRIVG